MNMPHIHTLFGILDSDSTGFTRFAEGMEKLYGGSATTLISRRAGIGFTGDGPLVGSATDGDISLAFLGALHTPLPGWREGSPLDDPNRTAAFLLQRYREKQLGFLDGTIGAFIVGLWDAGEERFIVANDPGGMRTAFYTHTPSGLTFSSTLYGLNCVTGNNGLDIDRSLEDFLLGYEFLPWRQTLYQDTFSLAPGMLLEWHQGKVRQHRSRTPDCSAKTFHKQLGENPEEDVVCDHLFSEFKSCLNDMLPTDGRVAILLGGFDSALVAVTCHALGKEVATYSFRFPEPRYNQAHAEEVAQLCGARHHWIDIDPALLKDGLQRYPTLFNQPSCMPHYLIQTAHVLQRMRQDGYRHCLTGDGCDEIFLGYPTVYKRARLFQYFHDTPHWITNAGTRMLGFAFIERLFGHTARFTRNFLTIASRPMPRRGHISNRIFDRYSLRQLRKEKIHQAMDSESILASLSLNLGQMSPVRLAYDGKSMPGLNKTKLAGASSASGMTVLSPFQHPHLVAFARTMPEHMLRPNTDSRESVTGKYLLMRAVERKKVLPPEIIHQPKQSPVGGMVDYWYMDTLKEFLLEQISNLPFDYDEAYVRSLLKPRLVDELFRKKVSLGDYILKAPSLLATYAAFNRPQRGKCSPP